MREKYSRIPRLKREMKLKKVKNLRRRYLEEAKLEVEEKKETEAQSCLDRIWYSLSCSARFDRVIIANPIPQQPCGALSFSFDFPLSLENSEFVYNDGDDAAEPRANWNKRTRERKRKSNRRCWIRIGWVRLRGPPPTITPPVFS